MVVSAGVAGLFEKGLRIHVRHGPGEVLLAVDGELDMATTPRLESALADVLAGGSCPRVVLDLGGLGFMDACALGCIVRIGRRLAAGGGALVVLRPSRPARRLLELCGLGGLLG